MMHKRTVARLMMGVVLVLGTGCDSTSTQPDVTNVPLPPAIDSADFAASVASENPFFPLTPGTSRRIVGQTENGEAVILVEVTDQKKDILGVRTTGVRKRVWLDGNRVEDTVDWYAQDKDGNVWHFGEEIKMYTTGRAGPMPASWEAGVDGAKAGVIMWAAPKVGSIYYQEYYPGKAQGIGEVLSRNETVTVPYGRMEDCLKIENTTPLDPDVREHTYYCPGIGHALTVDMDAGGTRFELVALEEGT